MGIVGIRDRLPLDAVVPEGSPGHVQSVVHWRGPCTVKPLRLLAVSGRVKTLGSSDGTETLVRDLLRLEDGSQEEVLQLLVGVVDAQLLERIDLKDLEAKDV